MTADEATLARLMGLAQLGDAAAYRQLLGLCAPLIRRFYARRLPDGALDDLVQETLMSLHRKRDSWDPARPFIPWMAAIARYRWVDHLRRVYAAPEAELGDDFGVESGEAAIAARFGCDRLLAMLPEAQAGAIRATRIDGLSTAEAAERLGQSEALVKVNVHRGLKKLAALVEDE
jgi:RNA polymerase sigma-70 factor (ECF subfamily)